MKMVDEMIEYARHLPADDHVPLEVLILRGHLLIEAQLDALIEARLRKLKPYRDARLAFSAKLKIAEALYGDVGVRWLAVRELNTIRNSLAHHLDDETVSPRVRKLLSMIEGSETNAGPEALLVQLALGLSQLHLSLVKVRLHATA